MSQNDLGRVAAQPGSREPSPTVSALRASIPRAVIGITGTRWNLEEPQRGTLLSVLIGFREGGSEWQHNGDCVGADKCAGDYWRTLGGRIHLHPPTIRTKRAFQSFSIQSAARPYLDRNRDIVDESDVLVALPQEEFEQERSGTWATVRYARTLKRPIMIIWPSGRWTIENGPASAIEARSGETGTGSTVGESAVPEADAPNSSPKDTKHV